MNLLIGLATENHKTGGHAVAEAIVRDGEICESISDAVLRRRRKTSYERSLLARNDADECNGRKLPDISAECMYQ